MDPVVASDGFTYDRSCIEEWFKRGTLTSTMTGLKVANTNLFENRDMKSRVLDWLELGTTCTTGYEEIGSSGKAEETVEVIVKLSSEKSLDIGDNLCIKLKKTDTISELKRRIIKSTKGKFIPSKILHGAKTLENALMICQIRSIGTFTAFATNPANSRLTLKIARSYSTPREFIRHRNDTIADAYWRCWEDL